MRQWGSSLNHNVMSSFLAAVRKATRLYRGSRQCEPVVGMEWLASEPEHALLVARPSREILSRTSWFERLSSFFGHAQTGHEQFHIRGDVPQYRPGCLHPHRTTRNPKLLYIDGMSAAKTEKGTLDSQDHVLLKWADLGAKISDYTRAASICKVIEEDWHSKVDGAMSMEAGFEATLRGFATTFKVVDITRVKERTNYTLGMNADEDEFFAYWQAIASSYRDMTADGCR
jgi:hypothetical protein